MEDLITPGTMRPAPCGRAARFQGAIEFGRKCQRSIADVMWLKPPGLPWFQSCPGAVDDDYGFLFRFAHLASRSRADPAVNASALNVRGRLGTCDQIRECRPLEARFGVRRSILPSLSQRKFASDSIEGVRLRDDCASRLGDLP
jgi:hypothetical protein